MIKSRSFSQRSGFTLVELLIVISILVTLLIITIYSVNVVNEGQRVVNGAAQVQSYLAGARDRAIHDGEPRGVRLFVDPQNPRAVSSLAFVRTGDLWAEGRVELRRADRDGNNVADNPDVTLVSGLNLGWWQLKRRGLLVDGAVIEIPRGSGNVYEFDTNEIDILTPFDPSVPDVLTLRIPYAEPGASDLSAVVANPSVDYEIRLPAQLLPQEPVLMPEGTVIDLDGSTLPIVWRPDPTDSEGQFSPFMDIFFSPRGNLIGPAASTGLLHLYVCDSEETILLKDLWLNSLDNDPATALGQFELSVRGPFKFIPADEAFGDWTDPDGSDPAPATFTADEPYLARDRRLVTVFAQTGNINVSDVDPTDGNGDGFADIPYSLAESGVGAK